MGEDLITECTNCHDHQQFMLGVGKMELSIDRIIEFSHYQTRRKIKQFIGTQSIESTEAEHKLFACPRCQTAHSRMWIKLQRSDGEIFETQFKCPKCRSILQQAQNDITAYQCRECGEKSLEVVSKMMWD